MLLLAYYYAFPNSRTIPEVTGFSAYIAAVAMRLLGAASYTITKNVLRRDELSIKIIKS